MGRLITAILLTIAMLAAPVHDALACPSHATAEPPCLCCEEVCPCCEAQAPDPHTPDSTPPTSASPRAVAIDLLPPTAGDGSRPMPRPRTIWREQRPRAVLPVTARLSIQALLGTWLT